MDVCKSSSLAPTNAACSSRYGTIIRHCRIIVRAMAIEDIRPETKANGAFGRAKGAACFDVGRRVKGTVRTPRALSAIDFHVKLGGAAGVLDVIGRDGRIARVIWKYIILVVEGGAAEEEIQFHASLASIARCHPGYCSYICCTSTIR